MVIVIKTIFAIISDVEIFPSVVVVVSDANSLTPSCRDESRFLSHIGKSSIMIVVIQMVRRGLIGGGPPPPFALSHEEGGPRPSFFITKMICAPPAPPTVHF